MSRAICVYCSSSVRVDPRYFAVARDLGSEIGKRGYTLIYGGGGIGLMGAVARSAKERGAEVIGILPEYMDGRGITYDGADRLIFTKDLRERKAVMEEKSDAFISLPGGFGTLEETLEILTLKQLHVHNKPVVIVNTGDFYRPLLDFFERLYEESFARRELRESYRVETRVSDALRYIEEYQPKKMAEKWF
jgi:uncharacterized protein (TIGR00730 family)